MSNAAMVLAAAAPKKNAMTAAIKKEAAAIEDRSQIPTEKTTFT